MSMITIEQGQFGSDYVVAQVGGGETLLVTTDYDYPGLASTFGWVPCDCGETDGTVDCPHRTASEMISEAAEYLDNHVGDEVEDPGYFSAVVVVPSNPEEVGQLTTVAAPDKGRPEAGKVYRLIGGSESASIANGNTWSESEIDQDNPPDRQDTLGNC